MPVTAKLSLQLYERLGEAVANELVGWFNQVDFAYREELGRLTLSATERTTDHMDRRFAEFDLKLERRFQEFEAKMEKRFAEFEAKNEKRFAEAEAKTEKRFAEADAKTEKRFAEADAKTEKRFAELEAKMEKRFAESDAKHAALKEDVGDLRIEMNRRFADLETRLVGRIDQIRGDMASFKAELIKWMFLFWIGSVATALAISQALK